MLNCPFPSPLTKESRLLLGIFFFLCHCISGWLALSTPSLRYKKKKEPRELTIICSLGSRSPNWFAFFFTFLKVLFLYVMSRIFSFIQQGNKEEYLYSTFPIPDFQSFRKIFQSFLFLFVCLWGFVLFCLFLSRFHSWCEAQHRA